MSLMIRLIFPTAGTSRPILPVAEIGKAKRRKNVTSGSRRALARSVPDRRDRSTGSRHRWSSVKTPYKRYRR